MRFDGKVAIVTGGGTGIGRAVAIALAQEGARVAIVGRRVDRLQETARLIGQPEHVLVIPTDVSHEDQVQRMVEQVVGRWAGLNLLFSQAGILHPRDSSILDIDVQVINETLATNVLGHMLAIKHCARQMVKGGGGSIVVTSSDLSFVALPGVSAYVTSKGAITSLTRAAAADLAQYNIRVNAVCPGFVYTEMTAAMAKNTAAMDAMRETYLIKELGQPEDVVEAVLYFLGNGARFTTGATLLVDGGHVVR